MTDFKDDQASSLRQLVDEHNSQMERDQISTFPPRSTVHRRIKRKNNPFLFIRILLIAFIVIIITTIIFSLMEKNF
ncbi:MULTISPECIES: hypothetical protein [Gracilibacillus]|uniref:Uncharacterized protein n=1 Tax=Gracilibacillus dipsosauri TaxID=178340 RepID=A0A317L181_9BACI|nr:hypothetical protein [Gracilibacillus dipsosauri]PWU68618.1 hypothetical protein DLJ74_09300 [Gracilibacillus dipsosauri]